MTAHKVVVIGGSAGDLEALETVVAGLPADLPAAVFIVVHLPPGSRSRLPEILSRAATLPARLAEDGAPFQPGHIYVAPADHHLLVRPGRMELSRGPRENHTRPAIDPLFRSAARAYGPSVVAVLLSGGQGDGTLGLMAVKSRGGMCLVQDPDEAIVSSMPSTAIRAGVADEVLPAAGLAPAVIRLTYRSVDGQGVRSMSSEVDQAQDIIAEDVADQTEGMRHGMTTFYTCPDCGGVLWQLNEGHLYHFLCHLGHSYAPEVLLIQQTEELEYALWSAVRSLREKSVLLRQMARNLADAGNQKTADRMEEQARADERSLDIIQGILLGSSASLAGQPQAPEQDVAGRSPDQPAAE